MMYVIHVLMLAVRTQIFDELVLKNFQDSEVEKKTLSNIFFWPKPHVVYGGVCLL